MTQLTFSLNFYWKICFKFCILEQIIVTVLFICISSINNKRSLLRFQSTTAPTNRGWSACGLSSEASQTEEDFFSLPARTLSCYSLVMTFKDLSNLHLISYDDSLIDDGEFIVPSDLYYSIMKAFSSSRSFCFCFEV